MVFEFCNDLISTMYTVKTPTQQGNRPGFYQETKTSAKKFIYLGLGI